MKLKNNIWIKRLTNRYALVGIAFAIWMLFLDANSFMVHRELDQELDRMEENIEYYEKELEVIREQLQALESDPEKLEKFAREAFYMHREGEEIYLIE